VEIRGLCEELQFEIQKRIILTRNRAKPVEVGVFKSCLGRFAMLD
jgi:hypothetical protein